MQHNNWSVRNDIFAPCTQSTTKNFYDEYSNEAKSVQNCKLPNAQQLEKTCARNKYWGKNRPMNKPMVKILKKTVWTPLQYYYAHCSTYYYDYLTNVAIAWPASDPAMTPRGDEAAASAAKVLEISVNCWLCSWKSDHLWSRVRRCTNCGEKWFITPFSDKNQYECASDSTSSRHDPGTITRKFRYCYLSLQLFNSIIEERRSKFKHKKIYLMNRNNCASYQSVIRYRFSFFLSFFFCEKEDLFSHSPTYIHIVFA